MKDGKYIILIETNENDYMTYFNEAVSKVEDELEYISTITLEQIIESFKLYSLATYAIRKNKCVLGIKHVLDEELEIYTNNIPLNYNKNSSHVYIHVPLSTYLIKDIKMRTKYKIFDGYSMVASFFDTPSRPAIEQVRDFFAMNGKDEFTMVENVSKIHNKPNWIEVDLNDIKELK